MAADLEVAKSRASELTQRNFELETTNQRLQTHNDSLRTDLARSIADLKQ